MLTTIKPSKLKGAIQAPASKSSMQRACAAALLNKAETTILNPGHSNDDKAALGVIAALGAALLANDGGSLRITSQGVSPEATKVHCGESGLGIRMFAPVIALSDKPITVTGEGSLVTRPMDFFDEIFPQLGIRVVSNKGRLPLEIQGPLQPKTITIDGSLSSQFLTGLLFSYAAAGAKDVAIKVDNLKSRPYIDLTLNVLKQFGWMVENRDYEEFYFPGAANTPQNRSYIVEGDWSGGAFLLVAGAVAGPITIKGLDTASTQADKAIMQALKDSGAAITEKEGAIVIGPAGSAENGSSTAVIPSALKAFHFDATDCPDLFPPLVALASYCEGVTTIDGVSRLAHKESDRGLTLQDEFGKMGITIQLDGDRMRVHGGKGVKGTVVHSRHDHRIAMACAVAALQAEGETTIEEAQAINKSYPDFYDHIQQLGAVVSIKTQLV